MRMVSRLVMLGAAVLTQSAVADDLELELRFQKETSSDSGRYHTSSRKETWNPAETALVVCDMWDLHHCLNAVRRGAEIAPRLDQVLTDIRNRGVTIIHAPSSCMEAYAGHPARKRAEAVSPAKDLPPEIEAWCSRIPAEERGKYPIDQSDGGEDDDPAEHKAWAEKLTKMGRNPRAPWKKQTDLITIDADRDFISDSGPEVWSIMEQRGIKNVILAGVHTNMCVLGRPFGLRQMAKNGKHVVLMRDMTDTMYNPKRWPYVSHFTGTDLIVSHIEKFVCPTITSDQILDGVPFRYRNDRRPHVAIIMAEDEYETARTLPKFAAEHLGKAFRVSLAFGSDEVRNDIPGIDVLDDADVVLISIRRRVLEPKQMAAIRKFVRSGKPVIGIRTASHAFSLNEKAPPDGFVAWEEFDGQVFGGAYHGHHGNDRKATIRTAPDATAHAILTGVPRTPFVQGGSLYQTNPLAQGTKVLLSGSISGQPSEPVAWTFKRVDGGKSFYASMGHKADFENPAFVRLLLNSIYWAAELPVPNGDKLTSAGADFRNHWTVVPVPGPLQARADGAVWYRCVVRVPASWKNHELSLAIDATDAGSAWFNGHPLEQAPPTVKKGRTVHRIPPARVVAGDANMVVVRLDGRRGEAGLRTAPILSVGTDRIDLRGAWQCRIGDDPSWSNAPLPAKFAASTDIVFDAAPVR